MSPAAIRENRLEDLRAHATLLRTEISRIVTGGLREQHRARLAELRSLYFGVLDQIDRMQRPMAGAAGPPNRTLS